MKHTNVFLLLILLMSCWAVAASLVAEQTIAGRELLQTSHLGLCVDSSRMELLSSFLRARLSAVVVISLSSPDLRCFLGYSSTVCSQQQGLPRT